MTPQQLIGIGVRLFAVWLAISSVRYFSSVPAYMASTNEIAEKIYQSYIFGGAYLVAAVVLWMFPLSVAQKIIPRSHYKDSIQLNSYAAAQVGCALLGLWLLSKALPDFVGNLLILFIYNVTVSDFNPHSKVEFGVQIFELLLSLLMIFKANVFAALVMQKQKDVNDGD